MGDFDFEDNPNRCCNENLPGPARNRVTKIIKYKIAISCLANGSFAWCTNAATAIVMLAGMAPKRVSKPAAIKSGATTSPKIAKLKLS